MVSKGRTIEERPGNTDDTERNNRDNSNKNRKSQNSPIN